MKRIQTLGGLAVFDGARPLGGSAQQPRRLAILAVLARMGARGVSRDRLVALLWPDAEEERSRRSLNQALYALRKDLGSEEAVLGTRDLRLNSALVETDVGEFEAAAASGALEESARLYGGPFLGDFTLPGATDFARWAEAERDALQGDYRRILESVATAAGSRGDWGGAVLWWRRLAALDSHDAQVAQGLMRALAAVGDVPGALRHAEIFTTLRQQQLELPPDPIVVALGERIRQGQLPPALRRSPARPSAPAVPSVRTPMDPSKVAGSAIVTDLFDRLSVALASRYQLEKELGQGGMAVVYLARDLKYERAVAMKVLRPELAAEVGPTRFLREIQIAARLHHPHILPLYDSDQVDDLVYYAMPYIEGETLRDRLARERQLPIADALQIAREVADALNYAHSSNVIHRDIKPANILLDGGHALVADFGIARAIGGESLTQQIIGTPAYMSPEQIDGSEYIDGRSDLYSLASVLFEMLVGEPPFRGRTVTAVIASRLSDAMPSPSAFRELVPETIDAAVRKAMATLPADRFATAAEFAAALGSPATVAVAVGAAPAMVREVGAATSVAVLPFENMSPDRDNEYFSDGLTEELTEALSHVSGLRVASRTSAFSFKGKEVDAREIGARLRVSLLVEGSVRKIGNRIRVTAQMIDAADGYHLWSESFDRTLTDVFALQAEIAQSIVAALSLRVPGIGGAPRIKAPTGMPEAYTLYLRGRYFAQKRDPESLRVALEYFEQAIELDPTYALAHAGLGEAWALRGFEEFGDLPPIEAMPRAIGAVNRALELDPELAEAHLFRGVIALLFEYDPAEAVARLTHARALAPRNPLPHIWYGLLLSCSGRFEEAIAQMGEAEQLDPVGVGTQWSVGRGLYFASRFEEALQRFNVVMELNPHTLTGAWAARAYLKTGRADIGLTTVEAAISRLGRQPALLEMLGNCLADLGRGDEARRIIEELEELGRVRHVSALCAASIHGHLGEHDAAFRCLEEAAGQRSGHLVFAGTWAGLERVRETPRYRELMRRVGLGALVPAA